MDKYENQDPYRVSKVELYIRDKPYYEGLGFKFKVIEEQEAKLLFSYRKRLPSIPTSDPMLKKSNIEDGRVLKGTVIAVLRDYEESVGPYHYFRKVF